MKLKGLNCCFVLFFLQILTANVSSQLPGITLPPWITLPPNIDLPENLPDDYMLVHQALITRRGNTNLNDHLCGGVIIFNFTVLTSANCLLKDDGEFFDENELSVTLGVYSIIDTRLPSPMILNVQEIRVHSRFNRRTQANNVAVIRLSSAVSPGPTISPTIPSRNKISTSMECSLLTYSNSLPNVIRIQPKHRNLCIKQAQESWPLETFCSGGSDFDLCHGNRGSALICGGLVQGIVTRSCNSSQIMQYTDISQFFFWIAVNQVDENPYRLMDSEIVRYLLFSVLDFIAWVVGTPGIADKFEFIKFFF